jgi:hypothetical protein
MSQPEIEISKHCSFCGASLRLKAHFCSQCGKSTEQKETQALDELKEEKESGVSAFEENKTVSNESVNVANQQFGQHTVPLETQQINLTDEEKKRFFSNERLLAESENKTDAISVWTNFEEREEVEVKEKGWNETSGTVPLHIGAIPTDVSSDKTKPDSLLEEINERALEKERKRTLKTFGVAPRLSPSEKAQKLMRRTRHSPNRIKRIVEKSQRQLDKASPDPSLRFFIISTVVFLFALLLFLLSRILK